MRQVTIAVVIPAYNAESFVVQALESVLAQKRRPEEVIVVDDGSLDNTAALVDAWSDANPDLNIRLLRQPNGGISSARNLGIRHATTDYVAFLDADDLLLPHHLELLSVAVEAHPEIAACFGDAETFNQHGTIDSSFLANKNAAKLPYEERQYALRVIQQSTYCSLIEGSYIPMCTLLANRKALIDVGLFDLELKTSEDRDLLLRLSRKGCFAYYPVTLARVRKHQTNTTNNRNGLLVNRGAVEVVWKMLQLKKPLHLTEEEISSTREVLWSSVFSYLYAASCHGPRAYLTATRHLTRMGIGIGPVRTYTKHLARAFLTLITRNKHQAPSPVAAVGVE